MKIKRIYYEKEIKIVTLDTHAIKKPHYSLESHRNFIIDVESY